MILTNMLSLFANNEECKCWCSNFFVAYHSNSPLLRRGFARQASYLYNGYFELQFKIINALI
jgi:hypothetical protein